MITINQKITSQAVVEVKEEGEKIPLPEVKVEESFETMNEKIDRPEVLIGSTYKIKPPTSDNSLYITINDIVLNEGTQHEVRQPYEMFINSKSMEHYQWVIALTRLISACFRKGGDLEFLNEELISVYDPNGGYYKKGGTYMPSLVAEIGHVVKQHMKTIGMIKSPELSQEAKEILNEKLKKLNNSQSESAESSFPPSAEMCTKCHEKSVVVMDGCRTCLNCGDGKCS